MPYTPRDAFYDSGERCGNLCRLLAWKKHLVLTLQIRTSLQVDTAAVPQRHTGGLWRLATWNMKRWVKSNIPERQITYSLHAVKKTWLIETLILAKLNKNGPICTPTIDCRVSSSSTPFSCVNSTHVIIIAPVKCFRNIHTYLINSPTTESEGSTQVMTYINHLLSHYIIIS